MRAITVIPGEPGSAELAERQLPVSRWADAYTRRADDIKTVLAFS
jgi:hypothetical protein